MLKDALTLYITSVLYNHSICVSTDCWGNASKNSL